ncbi:MAG: HNH endonuclease [Hymenobacteraceae bacterium]|nr:HNH endonuclease [Hymenobacteraceae bacterium]
MSKGQNLWTRDELILAINLYCKLPFGKIHKNNPEIIHLANLIGRTPSSLSYKLVNFASLDPSLQERGIKGAQNVSKLDKQIWTEFYYNWDNISFESEKLKARFERTTVEAINNIDEAELPKEGKVREQLVKVRVNQNFFRRTILAAYNSTCCITGLQSPSLLIAGHIVPWGLDENNRLNPRNGIAINALHDKAFEAGLITITPNYKIKVSSTLKNQKKQEGAMQEYFLKYDNQEIILPSKFLPDGEFLEYHNKQRFIP